MNTKTSISEITPLQKDREYFIKQLDKSEHKEKYLQKHADALYTVGLTMYSSWFSFESAVYNGFSASFLDENISLHPEQLKALSCIYDNKGLILSAPTSFGKTFIVFEYIAREYPKNIVLVVPTLALIDEYKRKIIKKYKDVFQRYKIYLSFDDNLSYETDGYNIFLVTHDRVVSENIDDLIKSVDFLVIDEVYKLQKNEQDDRVLILNLAYYKLARISKKYILLAPFIRGINNIDKLEFKPNFFRTDFSAVVNEVVERQVSNDKERFDVAKSILKNLKGNTLVYFPTVNELNSFISRLDDDEIISFSNDILNEFIQWAKKEIHEQWFVIKAMERGYLIHHGQLPLGIRMFELDLFNSNTEGVFNKMLCTSTLLEGVNTSAKNIIITKPSRGSRSEFDAFDFFNLVGRTGRLFSHYLGTAYYIRGPKDKQYIKNEALKSIEFELTSDSIDIDINLGNYSKHEDFVNFLSVLKIDSETYIEEIGSKCRFSTVKKIYEKYLMHKENLFIELERQSNSDKISKLEMIRALYRIIADDDRNIKLITFLINKLTYLNVHTSSIKNIVDSALIFYKSDINFLIKQSLYLKNSYIEFDFYKGIKLIQFFMKYEHQDSHLIEVINKKLINNIEKIYYVNAPAQKMLKDMGIYDGDINSIIKVIGNNFSSVSDFRNLIKNNYHKMKKVSVISKYVLKNFCDIQ